MSTSTTPHCPSCSLVYPGVDVLRCRHNGLKASPANADGCKRFEREPGSDDERLVWYEDAWHVAGEGRGD